MQQWNLPNISMDACLPQHDSWSGLSTHTDLSPLDQTAWQPSLQVPDKLSSISKQPIWEPIQYSFMQWCHTILKTVINKLCQLKWVHLLQVSLLHVLRGPLRYWNTLPDLLELLIICLTDQIVWFHAWPTITLRRTLSRWRLSSSISATSSSSLTSPVWESSVMPLKLSSKGPIFFAFNSIFPLRSWKEVTYTLG